MNDLLNNSKSAPLNTCYSNSLLNRLCVLVNKLLDSNRKEVMFTEQEAAAQQHNISLTEDHWELFDSRGSCRSQVFLKLFSRSSSAINF